MNIFRKILALSIVLLLIGCQGRANDPQPEITLGKVVFYSSFAEQPKTLDPARSYSTNESVFTANIYEPPLQYHYLKRPYQLMPLTATQMPSLVYLDRHFRPLPANAADAAVAYSQYDIHIKPGIYYQPHPGFARDAQGNFLYDNLSSSQLASIRTLADFAKTATRELTADDYVYEIKRLASPKTQSPIFSLMEEHIDGLHDYSHFLSTLPRQQQWLDLRKYPLSGAVSLDRYTYRVIIKGKYPQFLYWLAMPFFAPIPWEIDKFYSQLGLQEKNIGWDWYPVGTGPYMLTKNNPNHEMVLVKNPNFHNEYYPLDGDSKDKLKGYLNYAGQKIPFIDSFHFSLEKESIPRWAKFLQGYYDQSGISSDQYDQIIHINSQGQLDLTPKMQERHLHLEKSVSPAINYIGFNMLDDVVGGHTERTRKLRHAISIAIDFKEFISIFLNGRGILAQGPIPPGIFGYNPKQIDTYVFTENLQHQISQKNLAVARKLMVEAGYPNGRNPKTGEPLVLNFDTMLSSSADDKALFNWLRAQFAKLGIELQIRATPYNQFQRKMLKGNFQIFMWGWQADYPDPENFMFLLYGPNSHVKTGGENTSNYNNIEFNQLFMQMKNMPDSPERAKIIEKMIEIVQRDAPWVWGYYPEVMTLSQAWVAPLKPSGIFYNTLKYVHIDTTLRQHQLSVWNKPVLWPLVLILVFLLAMIGFSIGFYFWQLKQKPRRLP